MKNSEIIELTDKEIIEKIETQKAALSKLKLSHTISPLDNPNEIREARKTVARLKTELTKREMNKQK